MHISLGVGWILLRGDNVSGIVKLELRKKDEVFRYSYINSNRELEAGQNKVTEEMIQFSSSIVICGMPSVI